MIEKKVSSSAITGQIYKIFPNDLNSTGCVFGGVVMSEIDRLALVVAERHSGRACVTASVDAMHFLESAKEGETLVFHASINRIWTTSMEIGVRVDAESPRTGRTKHIVSAYLTFVATDEDFKPTKIIPVIPESKDEKRRYQEAEIRKKSRLKTARLIKEHRNS